MRAGEAEQVIPVLASWLRRLEAARRCGAEPRRWLSQPAAQEPPLQMALDGKPLRGPLAHAAPDQGSQQVVALYEPQTGIALAQQAVPDTGNEIPLEAALLTPRQVAGRSVTADAMPPHRAWCAAIPRFGGYDVLLAKTQQPTLEEDGRLCFSEAPLDCRDGRQARTGSTGHGRVDRRELVASAALHEWGAATWPGVEHVVCLTRTTCREGQRHTQTVYGSTSRSSRQASAERLLEQVQRHWRIENRWHWRRDGPLGEDHCQVGKGAARLVLAALNAGVVAGFDLLEGQHVPQQMRRWDAYPTQAIRLLLGSALTFPSPCLRVSPSCITAAALLE